MRYMDRLDYVSMVAGEHGFCMAIESWDTYPKTHDPGSMDPEQVLYSTGIHQYCTGLITGLC